MAAFGRGGIDETLMGKSRVDIYKSTGDEGMVKRPRGNGNGTERRNWRDLAPARKRSASVTLPRNGRK